MESKSREFNVTNKHPERYVPLGTYMNGCILKFFFNMFTFLEICIIIILDNKLIKVL